MLGTIRRNKARKEEKYPRIKMSIFPISKPDFKKMTGTKEEIILNWLKNWIKESLKSGEIQENNLLPVKADLAYYFGVGEGTIRNAVRKLEDEGVVVSKQRIGTLITSEKLSEMQKLTSKRDKVVAQIKKYIIDNGIGIGGELPVIKELGSIFDVKRNTMRSALDFLAFEGVIKAKTNNTDNKIWVVVKAVNKKDIDETINDTYAETLAQKISSKIEDYITENLKVGARIDAISVWAKKFNVSEKTAYDAMQILYDKGVIKARRGRYGTIIVKMPNESAFQPAKESSIFMSAEQAAVYSYKRIENVIRNKIKTEYTIGQKMPSMQDLSKELDVSTNTIRKAMLTLASEGYVRLMRGRFGGIYVLDIPEEETQSFKWLAVNPQYVKAYRN